MRFNSYNIIQAYNTIFHIPIAGEMLDSSHWAGAFIPWADILVFYPPLSHNPESRNNSL
jgi:hypothetical protein